MSSKHIEQCTFATADILPDDGGGGVCGGGEADFRTG